MKIFTRWIPVCLLQINISAAALADVLPLDLSEAQRLAAQADVVVPRLRANATALQERAVADRQLPDPKLKLGAMNLPIDSFDRSDVPMTQLQLGVQQAFPPGATLRHRSQKTHAMAEAGDAHALAQQLQLRRDVNTRYLELHYQLRAARIIAKSRRVFEQLVEITRAHYAAGRKNQQDVLRAGVELALLDDRETLIHTGVDLARAELAQLIGMLAVQRPLQTELPKLAEPMAYEVLADRLVEHPLLLAQGHQVEASQQAVELARQRYKPAWMLDVTYGERSGREANGSARSDFVSAMVVMDMPIFTGKRQDRWLAASQQEVVAARYKRQDRLIELQRQLDSKYAQWQRLGERLQGYEQSVLPKAHQNADASLNAYQSGVTDFTGLMRARLTELNSTLTALRLRVDRAQANAHLLYLAGGQP